MDTLHLDLAAGPVADPAAASMGNPHATFFVADVDALPIDGARPARWSTTRCSPSAPISASPRCWRPDRIRLRVWERGAGLTLACGSGACAALVNAHRRGLTGRRATVMVDGGELAIEWRDGRPRADDRPGRHRLHRRDRPRRLSAMSVEILTFGCRLNAYESEVMRGHAAGAAPTPSSSTPAP